MKYSQFNVLHRKDDSIKSKLTIRANVYCHTYRRTDPKCKKTYINKASMCLNIPGAKKHHKTGIGAWSCKNKCYPIYFKHPLWLPTDRKFVTKNMFYLLFIALYYRQLFEDIKIKNVKLDPFLFATRGRRPWLTKLVLILQFLF